MRSNIILGVLLLFGVAAAPAAEILTTHARTQPLMSSGASPTSNVLLAFTDRDIEVQARLFTGPSGGLSEQWWRDLSWILRQDGQAPRVITSADVRLVRSYRRPEPPREIFYAEFIFPALPAGSYELQANAVAPEGKQLTSEVFRFQVRTGQEDRDTRRSYLRFASDAVAATPAPDRYSQFRELMLELASLEPDDPGVWERLGDIAASVASPGETAAYYSRALEIVERNVREKFGSDVPQSVQERVNDLRQNLTAFARAVPHLRSDMRVVVSNREGKKRILLYRERALVHAIN